MLAIWRFTFFGMATARFAACGLAVRWQRSWRANRSDPGQLDQQLPTA